MNKYYTNSRAHDRSDEYPNIKCTYAASVFLQQKQMGKKDNNKL